MTELRARFKTTSSARQPKGLLKVAAGEYVFRHGELGAEMFVIHEGEVEVLSAADEERIAVLGKGDFFGEMSLFEDLPRSASTRAVRDTQLVRVDGATFVNLVRANPEIAVRILRKLSHRLRELENRVQTDSIPAVRPAGAACVRARLEHAGGVLEVELAESSPVQVGRRDPLSGVEPEVDLTPLDPEKSCSRRHALLRLADGRLELLEPESTTNGTFVNGKRLESGVAAAVQDGDRLRFGLVEAELKLD